MKIAYLMQIRDNILQAAHIITALASYEDDVFIASYDLDASRPLTKEFKNNPHVFFINENYEFMEGSLSIPRVWLLLLTKAVDNDKYDAYINVNEYTLPIISREKLEEQLLKKPDYDFIQYTSEDQMPEIRKKYQKFHIGPGDPRYIKEPKFRKRMNQISNFLYLIHIRRKTIPFKLFYGPCWFILSHATATKLTTNIAECSNYFNLAIFSQEVYFQSAIHKYSDHIINNCVVLLDSKWHPNFFANFVKLENIPTDTTKFFANKVQRIDNPELFDKFIELY